MQLSCPQCGKFLEAPEPLPQRAQCPFCSAVFTPTAVTLVPADRVPPAWAEDAVRGPATALLVLGIISLFFGLTGVVLRFNQFMFPQPVVLPPNFPFKIPDECLNPSPAMVARQLVWESLSSGLTILIIVGAYCMRRLRLFGLAMTSSILERDSVPNVLLRGDAVWHLGHRGASAA